MIYFLKKHKYAMLLVSKPDLFYLWSTNVIATSSIWVVSVCATTLMVSLTSSPILIGAIQTALSLPMLLMALPAGFLADNLSRRFYLVTLYSLLALSTIVLSVITGGLFASAKLLLIGIFLFSCLNALILPTWHALIADLVNIDEIQTVAALHSLGANLARALGSIIAALSIQKIGGTITIATAAFPFFLMAFMIKEKTAKQSDNQACQFSVSRHETTRKRKISPSVLWLTIASFLSATAISAVWSILPLILSNSDKARTDELGYFYGIAGFGAVFSLLVLSPLGSSITANTKIVLYSLLMSTGCGTISIEHIPLEFSLFIIGGAWSALGSLLNGQAQTLVNTKARGRAASLHIFGVYGGLSLGGIGWGGLSIYIQPPTCFLIAALFPITVSIGNLFQSHLRNGV